jgi:hypothetical protein
MLNMGKNRSFGYSSRLARYSAYLALWFALPSAAYAQRGDVEVGGSVGLGSQKQTHWVVPLSVRAAYELNPRYAIGIVGGYFHQKIEITGLQSIQNYYVAAVRADYRMYQFDKFKFYAALELGYMFVDRVDESTNPVFPLRRRLNSNELAWAGVGGVGYTFHKNFVAFLELGYGWSNSRLGISYRFAKPEADN